MEKIKKIDFDKSKMQNLKNSQLKLLIESFKAYMIVNHIHNPKDKEKFNVVIKSIKEEIKKRNLLKKHATIILK